MRNSFPINSYNKYKINLIIQICSSQISSCLHFPQIKSSVLIKCKDSSELRDMMCTGTTHRYDTTFSVISDGPR